MGTIISFFVVPVNEVCGDGSYLGWHEPKATEVGDPVDYRVIQIVFAPRPTETLSSGGESKKSFSYKQLVR